MQPKHGPKKHEEKLILAHDPVAGYRPVFYVTFTAGVLYLAYILFTTL
jgi:hypothetical protein